jgi:transglutaminase-like putative cysteine protease
MPEKSADEPQEPFETPDPHPPSQPNQDGINNRSSIRTESNILHNKKLFAFVIVVVIVLASVSYVLYDYSTLTPNNPNDPDFYDRYPTTPYDLAFVRIESSTLLWGNYTHDYVNNFDLLAVQITPTIQDLANGFKESYPDNITLQAKAAFDFVTEEISLGDDEPVYVSSYPETTLITKEGLCAGYASLLASLLYAEGLEVAFVYTSEEDGESPHIYVAVRLPGYTPPSNAVLEKIQSYIGVDWIGLDATGGYSEFGQLNPDYVLHWNIRKIVGVPIYGAVFTFKIGDRNSFASYDKELGYYFDIECELYAFEHDLDNDVTFTFELRENNVTIDREVINVTRGQDSLTEADFILGYLDDFDINDYWYDVEIYLIITP